MRINDWFSFWRNLIASEKKDYFVAMENDVHLILVKQLKVGSKEAFTRLFVDNTFESYLFLINNKMRFMRSLCLCFYLLLLCSASYAQSQKFKGYPDRSSDFDVLPGFVNPPKGYGNVPFYWWNGDVLIKERLKEQLDILSASATDGFVVSYIHTSPRVDTLENKNGYGLYGMTEPGKPQVFSSEWWDIWNWFSAESGRKGLGVGLDDYTVGWHGNGYYPDELDTMSVFNGYKGELEILTDTVLGGRTFEANISGDLLAIVAWPGKIELTDQVLDGKIRWTAPQGKEYHVYTIITKPGYVIHPEHGSKLVNVYFDRFETRMDEAGRQGMNYFFQDELSYPINMFSWSDDFETEFLKRKGYNIIPYLPALKNDIGDITPKIRLDYCEVLMDLSEERYYKPIYDWHVKRGLIYGCDNLGRGKDPTAYIDYFRAMSWFTAPGNDAPAKGSSFLETKVSSSITHLYNRPRTWLEAFHSMGWGSSGAWLIQQIDHHFVAGGNLVCMHGLYYSTHGGWWEWAPPDFHFRMPYWPHMKQWLNYIERMSYVLSQGTHVCDIAMLYPTESKQAYPDSWPNKTFNTALDLSNNGLDYDFVDFRSLRDAVISDRSLIVGEERYKIIILADLNAIHHSSLQRIADFYRSGGIVLATGNLPKASNRKGEDDPEMTQLLREIFGISWDETVAKKGINRTSNKNGGIGWYIPDSLENYIPELITPDFLSEKREGKVLHRKIGERDIYMVTDVDKDTECFFRAKGRVELWDANEGTVKSYPILRQTDEGTWMRLRKEKTNSYLIVFSPGEPELEKDDTARSRLSYQIQFDGEWEVELLPTLDNKWGDYRFPAFDGVIGAEARSFKYSPSTDSVSDWYLKEFDDSGWDEAIYGYGLQVETKTDDTPWEPISFSWQYGVWDNPGGQGYHGLKGKVDDRFFILDKGKNQQFRTFVYAPKAGLYRIETVGVMPDYIHINQEYVNETVVLSEGWHSLEVAYSDSEKQDFRMRIGHTMDNRKRSFVVLLPADISLPEKQDPYLTKVASRWDGSKHLLFDPYGGKYNQWNFRFESVPGLEEMVLTIYGKDLKIWFDGQEIASNYIQLIERGDKWNKYSIKLPEKKARIGTVAFSVFAEKGYQGAGVIKEPVQLKTSLGLLKNGDWGKEGALRFYSGGMYYRMKFKKSSNRDSEKVMLDLGDVVATCEVNVNGKSAGVLISPPYRLDIKPYLREGENHIEVLVYSTLSNHYQTIPTPYRGEPKAGLIGPVNISDIIIQ